MSALGGSAHTRQGSADQTRARNDGFSIVEMIIAMFLLAVLALAVLPLLIGATKTSAVNKDLVAATTFANGQIAPIRNAYPNDPATATTCSSLRSTYAKTGVVDPAGTGLKADTTIPACSTTASEYPKAVTVTVTVYPASQPSTKIVTIPTKVMVSAP